MKKKNNNKKKPLTLARGVTCLRKGLFLTALADSSLGTIRYKKLMMRIKKQAFEINTGINGELHLLASYHAKVNKSSNKFRLPRGGGRGGDHPHCCYAYKCSKVYVFKCFKIRKEKEDKK